MENAQFVPFGDGEAELIEKKSRFIGSVFLIASEDEAKAKIEEVHARFPDARHGVYAYDIKAQNITRFSDNGEPKGTAGMPVLDVFRKRGVTNFCCVVTRYFGGILLGAGGLVRAYSGTAALALDAAGTAQMMPFSRLEVLCEYPFYEKIQHLMKDFPIRSQDTAFDLDVTLTVVLPQEQEAAFIGTVNESTGGRAIVTPLGQVFLPVRV